MSTTLITFYNFPSNQSSPRYDWMTKNNINSHLSEQQARWTFSLEFCHFTTLPTKPNKKYKTNKRKRRSTESNDNKYYYSGDLKHIIIIFGWKKSLFWFFFILRLAESKSCISSRWFAHPHLQVLAMADLKSRQHRRDSWSPPHSPPGDRSTIAVADAAGGGSLVSLPCCWYWRFKSNSTDSQLTQHNCHSAMLTSSISCRYGRHTCQSKQMERKCIWD